MNPTIDDVRKLRAEIPALSWIRIEKAAFEPEFVIMVEELILEVEALQ